eukprot:6187343-Pleurochrysis_carterae.AAC.1
MFVRLYAARFIQEGGRVAIGARSACARARRGLSWPDSLALLAPERLLGGRDGEVVEALDHGADGDLDGGGGGEAAAQWHIGEDGRLEAANATGK